ncbi:hypothetical protein HV449_14280 [Bacillus sporothermodurans]|uniref:hypothetical protein n=1 Tax=Heyndrickxia sporothermodurans TaxID=46224 RepID=UPI00192C011B|nr:hypothetical protein [Heyndrickxia sporothermodurans]MBL5808064.1 hypothetical protein [Heyndrickxia sporothermodurans]
MNIYILNGFTEYSKCYELSSFGDAFLHFQDAKDEAEKKINHILQEFDVDKDVNVNPKVDHVAHVKVDHPFVTSNMFL